MLSFCLHSLIREYGWQFFRRVVLPHPVRAAKAFIDSGRLNYAGEIVTTFDGEPGELLNGPRPLVGAGFCLKPLDPPCMSGRPNHDCHYLERMLYSGSTAVPECCRRCAIREIGLLSMKAGAAFYIMTSAQDILLDVFAPALDEGRFTSGLFTICRYSLQPFAVGLLASGVRGVLFPFEQGDCRDYKTWLRADRGDKDEQTTFSEPNQFTIRKLLDNAAKAPGSFTRFRRQGNILHPEQSAASSEQGAGQTLIRRCSAE